MCFLLVTENPPAFPCQADRVRDSPGSCQQRASREAEQGRPGPPLARQVRKKKLGWTAPGRRNGNANTQSSRGLEFTCKGLANNVNVAADELSTSFRAAYDVTLKPHHSFLIKPIFSAAMSACPYRKDFYAKLGDDQDKVNAQLKEYLASLEKIVNILKSFLDSKGIKK